jgi:hypothetical protein
VKRKLITGVVKQGDTLIDYACGKAGDLPKWIAARASFVFGIDISSDNIENRIDGACVRYLNSTKVNKHMPGALFVNGNSAFNVKNGSAMLNDKAIQVTKAVFGLIPKEVGKLGKGVVKNYGVGEDGFHVSSCQFAFHYFLESPDTLQQFMKNLAECTKLNGYFIGTCYDGKEIFRLLKNKGYGESIQIVNDGKKVWEIIKGYQGETFEDDASSIGLRIDVYQDSINQLISEYLVNFDYLNRVMYNYGFKLVEREEATSMGLPEGSGLFSELFLHMTEEVSKNSRMKSNYGDALQMKEYEKKISFLNRYFVYKKFMNVNPDKVQLEFGEFEESVEDEQAFAKEEKRKSMKAIKTMKTMKTIKNQTEKEQTKKPVKIRKLTKKLVLEPATEALEVLSEKKTKTKKTMKPKIKKLVIQEDSDED